MKQYDRYKDSGGNFDEYLRQGEPSKKAKAANWQTAIGLQAVDGLQVSDYLLQTARRHIEGEMERFFRNFLLGEQWDLRNRYLHIHPTEEWSVQPNLATRTSSEPLDQRSLATRGTQETPERVPEQVPEQVKDLLHTNNTHIIRLIKEIGDKELSIAEIMKALELKHRPNFLEYHLNPAITDGYVRLMYPDKPRHPRQKYLLTVKGLALYNELNKEK